MNMKNNNLLALMIILFGIEFSAAAIQENEQQSTIKLVKKYEFEDVSIGQLPSGWGFSGRKEVSATVTNKSSTKNEQCLKIVSRSEDFGRRPIGAISFKRIAKKLRGKRVRFRASVNANLGDEGKFTFWLMETLQSGETGIFDNMLDRPIKQCQWEQKEIVVDLSDDSREVSFGFLMYGKGEVSVDNIFIEIVDRSVPVTRPIANPIRPKKFDSFPGLFEIKGSMEVRANLPKLKGKENGGQAKLLVPLPLRYRDQYPISYQLAVDPPDALAGMKIAEDQPGNFVAEIDLQQFTEHKKVNVKFSSLVLVKPSDFSTVPKSAPIAKDWNLEAQRWLKSTWCADAEHSRIKEIASKIRQQTDDVLKIVSMVEARAKKVFGAAIGKASCLTATVALDKKGTCTSRANFVAALLRSSGVPARVLAGYPSWSGPLQTHYIVEAYVPTFGWYPIESTMCQSPWPNHRQINVAVVVPKYESKELAGPRTGVVGGVPYLSLTEIPDNDNLFFTVGTIPGHPYRDHVCNFIRKMDGSESAWKKVADQTETRWKKWLTSPSSIKEGKVQFGPNATMFRAKSPTEFLNELQRS